MFFDRQDAGRQLTHKLLKSPIIQRAANSDLMVLSIPRGGVMVGVEVAKTLNCAHDVVLVKKIGFPNNVEMAVGAMAEDGWTTIDHQSLLFYGLTSEALTPSLLQTRSKIDHYKQLFRQGKALNVADKTVILIDDGIATGETMKAAVHWVRQQGSAELVVAAPVCAWVTAAELRALADEFVCLSTPQEFVAVGQFYERFEQVDDDEVLRVLSRSK